MSDLNQQILEHVIDIKERMSSMETSVKSLVDKSQETEVKLEAVEKDVAEGKTTLKILKYIAGVVIGLTGTTWVAKAVAALFWK